MNVTIRTQPSGAPPIDIHCFPSEDRNLAVAVGDLLDRLPEDARSPEVLEARLQTIYPHASVRLQDAMAHFGTQPTWYVFRDGRVGGADGRDDAGLGPAVEAGVGRAAG